MSLSFFSLPFLFVLVSLLIEGGDAAIIDSDFLSVHPDPSITAALITRIHVNPSNHFMIDRDNRVRIFHGVNHVYKEHPFIDMFLLQSIPDDYLSFGSKSEVSIAEIYSDLGFNAIRLGVLWNGVLPNSPKEYNNSYMAAVSDIVTTLKKNSIYTLIDSHQDVLSSLFGTYDAFPQWAIRSHKPSQEYPWPFPANSPLLDQWALHYFTESASSFFQALYQNTNGLTDYYSNGFWRYVAKYFSGEESVIGYDLINEPFCGDVYTNPFILLPGQAGAKNLQPFYHAIAQSIREVDDDTIIFYEPVTWGTVLTDAGDAHIVGTGFTEVPGGKEYQDRSVLSYHYYCWFINGMNMSNPYPAFNRAACNSFLGPLSMSSVIHDISAVTGGGSFLTEFGLCIPDGDANSTNTIECDSVMDLADSHMQSWSYWMDDYALFDWNGRSYQLNNNAWKSFSRAYPQAIAGIPLSYSFDISTSVFSFRYRADPTIRSLTEVYLPIRFHYRKGYLVDLSDNAEAFISTDRPNILFLSLKNNATDPVVTLNVTPKSSII